MDKLLKKCPNCGADIKHYYNHRCPFCRTYLHMTDETIKKINNCDYNVKEVFIEKNPLMNSYILTVLGWTTPKMHYFEEGNNEDFIISGTDTIQKVGYKINIPLELIYNRDERTLIDYILESIPPELCDGYNEDKILSKVYEFLQQRFR